LCQPSAVGIFSLWYPLLFEYCKKFYVSKCSVEEEWDALSEANKSSQRPSADVSRTFYHEKNQGQYLVLSVDDDPINQMVVESLLGPEGFKVILLTIDLTRIGSKMASVWAAIRFCSSQMTLECSKQLPC
jgi:hypothetical protein